MVGCTISIAKNGVEAVEKTQNQSFDLVLMDVNMPIMDGIQATQILRRSKKPEIANLPIIACTANAIKGDSERFLSEGFSDYMSKPFKEEDLMKLLDKYLNTTSKQTLPKDFAHSDSKMYELKLPAMSNGSSELQSRLNAVFVETMPENIERIQLAVENKDIEDLKDVAHKMKSNIDLFNITSIRDDIRFLESDAIENETWHDIQNYVKKITFTLENVILALKK
jgi:CheY-like chemotaxis protein/HPt (histidine-containing phosphotransfer) domain-containing protein